MLNGYVEQYDFDVLTDISLEETHKKSELRPILLIESVKKVNLWN